MKITVTKFDPAVDSAPYEVSGEVDYWDNMSALEALVQFHENVEAVNFDYNCACRMCGRCAMMIDGVPGMACVTLIEDTDHTFAPLEGYPVIRDLIVDKTALNRRISRIAARVRTEPVTEENIVGNDFDPDTKDLLYAMEFCARCGACNVACPALEEYPEEFIGPSAMIALTSRHLDPLDQSDRVLQAVSGGLYHCILCGQCDEVCAQQDIDHLQAWKILRDAAEERGLVPSYAS